MKGHQNSILDIQWSVDGSTLYSASADKNGAVWNVETNERIKKLSGHSQVVTSISPAKRGPPLILTSSDDGSIKLWDVRTRGYQKSFSQKYPVLVACLTDSSDSFFFWWN